MFGLSSKKSKRLIQNTLFYPRIYTNHERIKRFVSYNILKDETLCLFYYKSVVEALIIKQFILTPIKGIGTNPKHL